MKQILDWQKIAVFSNDVDEIGCMIQEDAQHINSTPGFGLVCSAELAGETGTSVRFPKQSGFSIYLGMSPLDNQSGGCQGTKSRVYYNKKRAEGKRLLEHWVGICHASYGLCCAMIVIMSYL